jgi:nicotinamidase-related amidase
MTERIWDKFLTKRDKAIFAAGGFGARAGFGKRPALLVIDVNWAFCGERPAPILDSIKRWRTSCGKDAWVALEYIKTLIEAAHAKGIPVIAAERPGGGGEASGESLRTCYTGPQSLRPGANGRETFDATENRQYVQDLPPSHRPAPRSCSSTLRLPNRHSPGIV